jgi:hypothetical protein
MPPVALKKPVSALSRIGCVVRDAGRRHAGCATPSARAFSIDLAYYAPLMQFKRPSTAT